MNRTERLLDVVALLLDANHPLSFAEIREVFAGEYEGSIDSAERKFERDKAELLELGIPIVWRQATDERAEGYTIDRDSYYLPEVGLAPDELAVLYAAGSAVLVSDAFPGRQDLAHALRKIGFFSDGPLPTPKVRLELGALADVTQLPARLETLWSAISARKSIELGYYSPATRARTQRTVDPLALVLRRGLWTLVGHCHLRQQVRTFHVHRIETLAINPARPRSPDFTVPADFDASRYVATWPWQHRFHPPVDVELSLREELAPMAARLFPVTPRQGAEGEARLTVSATDLDGLLRFVLSLGPQAAVLGPPEATARLRAMAQRIADAHSTEGASA